jgi:hypothetical protein
MIPYLARLLEVTINNGTLPSDWKMAIVVPIYKGGGRSVVRNYRPVSLTSVVCKQMEHVIAGYIIQVWEENDWLFEGQHGFRPRYSCETQIITVFQDIADALDHGWPTRGPPGVMLWPAELGEMNIKVNNFYCTYHQKNITS